MLSYIEAFLYFTTNIPRNECLVMMMLDHYICWQTNWRTVRYISSPRRTRGRCGILRKLCFRGSSKATMPSLYCDVLDNKETLEELSNCRLRLVVMWAGNPKSNNHAAAIAPTSVSAVISLTGVTSGHSENLLIRQDNPCHWSSSHFETAVEFRNSYQLGF